MSILGELVLIRDVGKKYPDLKGIFGSGIDGNATISVPSTLTQDMYYDTLTVNSELNANGYRIFAKTAIVIGPSGIIKNDGFDGTIVDFSSPTGGGSGAPQVTYITTPGLMRGGGDGGAGDAVGGIDGESIIGIGGDGGQGGGSDYNPGGNGGVSSVTATSGGGAGDAHPIRTIFHAAMMIGIPFTNKIGGGSGGGGGGGEYPAGAAVGGNGGGGAGVILLCSPSITGTGIIRAIGGNGVESASPSQAGGGGGGGGGAIVIISTRKYDSGLTLDVSGGVGAQGPIAQAQDGSPGTIYSFELE